MKVVCISELTGVATRGPNAGEKVLMPPKKGEIVTASQCPDYDDAYCLAEYPLSKKGNPQAFGKSHFRSINELNAEYTEAIVKKITKEIKIEIPELV